MSEEAIAGLLCGVFMCVPLMCAAVLCKKLEFMSVENAGLRARVKFYEERDREDRERSSDECDAAMRDLERAIKESEPDQ